MDDADSWSATVVRWALSTVSILGKRALNFFLSTVYLFILLFHTKLRSFYSARNARIAAMLALQALY